MQLAVAARKIATSHTRRDRWRRFGGNLGHSISNSDSPGHYYRDPGRFLRNETRYLAPRLKLRADCPPWARRPPMFRDRINGWNTRLRPLRLALPVVVSLCAGCGLA